MGRDCTALALWMALIGCASAQPAHVADPAIAAQRFGKALVDDQPEVAYALLDPEQQRAIDRARFLALWRSNRQEVRDIGERITRGSARPVARTHLELEGGERVTLVLEDGQWRIEGGVMDAQALGTPIDAVLELRRALQRQSLPSLLRVLSRERRAAWLAAFDKNIQQTADALDLRVEVHDDDAIVHLSG